MRKPPDLIMKASINTKPTKLYCYVDETGQDSRGKFFIVVAVVVGQQRDMLELFLEQAETQTGKGKVKWTKSGQKRKDNYLNAVLLPQQFKNSLFYRIYENGGAYEDLTVLAIAQAINLYREKYKLNTYQATVLVDGLKGAEVHRVGRDLHNLGVKTRKIRGVKDESEPLIRLADAVAGLIRQAYLGVDDYQKMKLKLQKEKVLNEL